MSCVYLLHFDQKLGHAQHYIGFTIYADPWRRIAHHRAGRGAHLTKALVNKGIGFKVVRIWEGGDRSLERNLKDHHKSKDLCPICNPKMRRHLIWREI